MKIIKWIDYEAATYSNSVCLRQWGQTIPQLQSLEQRKVSDKAKLTKVYYRAMQGGSCLKNLKSPKAFREALS